MPMHGPTSNKIYVKRIVPFARAERHRGVWQIFDSRSRKVLSETCQSEAKAWADVSLKIRANGGSLINHRGAGAIQTVRDARSDDVT